MKKEIEEIVKDLCSPEGEFPTKIINQKDTIFYHLAGAQNIFLSILSFMKIIKIKT